MFLIIIPKMNFERCTEKHNNNKLIPSQPTHISILANHASR